MQSIDPLGVKTESVKTFSDPQLITVTSEGLQTEPMKIKRNRGVKWVFLGLGIIGGVAAGVASK